MKKILLITQLKKIFGEIVQRKKYVLKTFQKITIGMIMMILIIWIIGLKNMIHYVNLNPD